MSYQVVTVSRRGDGSRGLRGTEIKYHGLALEVEDEERQSVQVKSRGKLP